MTRRRIRDHVIRRAGARSARCRWCIQSVFGLLTVLLAGASTGPAQAGSAGLVINSDSGAIHYAYRIDAPHPPASLTKMMTLYLTFEALRDGQLAPRQRLKVSRVAARQKPSRLGLRRGRTIRVEDAILALVTKSANDASVVLAEAIAGSEEAFARRMTVRAHALGMSGTVFRNASGLHHPEQVTTARDMARLAGALMRDFPRQYRLFATESFVWRGRRFRNHNSLLSSYVGADGIKTGYIRQAGFNLVASAQRDGHRLIGVVLGGKSVERREWMMATMLDHGFMGLKNRDLQPERTALPYMTDPSGEAAFEVVLRNVAKPEPQTEAAVGSPDDDPLDDEIHSGLDGTWAIQVGAYRTAPPAEEAAVLAANRIPSLLGHARVLVTQVVQGGQRMFRARLTGLSAGEAWMSCRQLARHGIPCLAVADTGEFRASGLVR